MEDKYYFIKRTGEKVLFTYKPKAIHRLIYIFSSIFWVPIPLFAIGIILCLTKLTDWKILYLFLFLSLISYLIALISSLSSKDLEYIITNKSIITLTGNSYSKINFIDIKSIKVSHNIFNKNNGNIKILLNSKKNFFNHLNGIENVQEVYNKISNIILDNSTNFI